LKAKYNIGDCVIFNEINVNKWKYDTFTGIIEDIIIDEDSNNKFSYVISYNDTYSSFIKEDKIIKKIMMKKKQIIDEIIDNIQGRTERQELCSITCLYYNISRTLPVCALFDKDLKEEENQNIHFRLSKCLVLKPCQKLNK